MMHSYTLMLLLLVSSFLVQAQTINTGWLAAFTTTKINKKSVSTLMHNGVQAIGTQLCQRSY